MDESRSRPARILLAEDELRFAHPVKETLELAGHKVEWVTQIRELRDAVARESPDLLILDTTLDTDGLEYFQAIRFAPEHPPAGVLILSEPGDIALRERAQQLGAAAVLMKPVDDADLVSTVENLLTYI